MPLPFRRICCPVDFSDASAGALATAAALARDSGASLTLLHVDVVPGSAIPEAMLPIPPDLSRDLSAPSDLPMAEWVARAERLGAPRVEARRTIGRPAEEILALLEAGRGEPVPFDLAVLGTHGRRGLGHALLGSVAEQVVRNAPCPVVTVGAHAAAASTT